ncbi:ABC transporter permease subunit [Spiroplasma clarkii]|nr:ABC transporter permease subunit [Spiroplasma clarkii]
MLFTFNGDVYFSKTKDKNLVEFKQTKIQVASEIKKDLKQIDSKLPVRDKLAKQIEVYQKGKDFDYIFEWKEKCAQAKISYLDEVNKAKTKSDAQISKAQIHWDSIKNDKAKYFASSKTKANHLFEEYKSKLSSAVTASEIKDVKLQYHQDKKVIKHTNEYIKAKTDLKYQYYVRKMELKKIKTTYVSNLENINNSTPIETQKWKSWVAPVTSVIPGVGQLINHQFKKGLIMMLLIPIVLLFIMYGFGIGNIEGTGILGLIDFGASDPNGDGRFYLIEGIIAIILIAVSVIIMIGSVIDAKLVAKQQYIGARARNWSQTNEFLKSQGTPYLLSFPAIIGILFIVLVPIIATIIIAFTNYGKGNDPARPGQVIEWVGFDNFAAIFGGRYSSSFGYVMLWTVMWVMFASVGAIVAGTLAALMVNNDRLKGKGFFRLFLILPWAVPAFIMIMMFSLLLANESFNEFTQKFFGVRGWTNQQTQARVALIFIQTWLGQSYMFLLITGILQGVSKDIYDASSIDGASRFKQTVKLTLPIVFGQIAPLILGQFTFNFGNFGIISLYGANGTALGPDGLPYPGEPGITDILISFVYKLSTSQTAYTYGIAASFVIVSSFVVVSISAVGFKNMKAFKN